jgi:hypothetical protein
MSLDDLGLRGQFEKEVERIHRFNCDVMGKKPMYSDSEEKEVDIKKYIKYILLDGSVEEKRNVLLNLKSKLILKDGSVYLDVISDEDESSIPNLSTE